MVQKNWTPPPPIAGPTCFPGPNIPAVAIPKNLDSPSFGGEKMVMNPIVL